MENLNTKVSQINQKFKNNALTSGIVNMALLALIFLFFSIGFDLTKRLLVDFVNLSWASIFPSIVDLGTVAGLILVLKYFANILQSPDFFLHLETKEVAETNPENKPKVVEFLNSSIYGKLLENIWYTIALFFVNFLLNICFEGGNNQFSPLNEWYLASSTFTHLPIFPINLLCIIILVALLLPTTLNYAKYKLEIAEVSKLHATKTINKQMIQNQVSEIKTYRFFIFVVLSAICIILSIMQRHNVWIFQYNNPIKEQSVLAEKLQGEASAFCEENLSFNTVHNKDVITVTEQETSNFTGVTRTNTTNYAITPELKQSLVLMCEKRAEENKKLIAEHEKTLDKESK